MKAAIVLIIFMAAGWIYLVQPNLQTEICPACLGKSAERVIAAKTQLLSGPAEAPPACAFCGNTGKVSPKQKVEYAKQLSSATPVATP